MAVKISVIIPCYNSEKYLDKCLKSLINQTFKDYEIICVNDGSVDSTLDILKKYNVKIINQNNLGVSASRNIGLQNADGEYITFIDSDDWVNPEYLENLHRAIIKNDCDIAISSMIRKRTLKSKYRMHFLSEKTYENLQEKLDICNIPACCYICGKLFKKSLIEKKPFANGMFFEDVLWTPYIIKDANKIVTTPNAYYYYRVNNNSIVKSVQSLAKQHDSYIAKTKLINFYEENNLILSEKYKNIVKYIDYLAKIPIFKTKEYKGKETTYLFGIIPILRKKSSNYYYQFKSARKIFFIRHLDSHIYINFLKLHLGIKTKNKYNYSKIEKYGLNNNKRNPQIIVSLTSFPARIKEVYKTINTLLNQTLKPDRLILWLAKEQFVEVELPENLLKLKEYGLEIRWCDDLKSYKKLIPALKAFPNDIIVTADDDLYYQKDWLESLYSAYLNNPKNIYTRRACFIKKEKNYFAVTPHYANNHHKPSYSNQLMGGAGTLYPPNSLYKDIFDEEKIKNLIPTYDDIYFWAMALLNGTKIGLIKNNDLNLYNVENTQNEALCKINNNSKQTMGPKEAFNIMFEYYPQLIERLSRNNNE